MIEGFLKATKNSPSSVAIIDTNGERYSYQELYTQAQRIAQCINEDSHCVGIYTDNNFFTYAAVLGVLLKNKTFVPLNNKFPDERLGNIIQQSNVWQVIACEESKEKVQEIADVDLVVADETSEEIEINFDWGYTPSDIAYILFTSGSTGVPKGIPISYKNFTSFIGSLTKKFELNEENKVLQAFELSFDVSIGLTFMALNSGAQLVLAPLDGIIAVSAYKAIIDFKIDFVTLPPSAVNYQEKYKLIPQLEIPFVRTTLFTGEALPYEVVRKWKSVARYTDVYNAYGPTEVTVWSYFYKLNDSSDIELVNGLCPIGQPLTGVDVMIQPMDGEKENKGELLLGGDHVFEKYHHDPDKTKNAFYIDEERKKWYRTGDAVLLNDLGNVVYINRLDNQVKVNGYRIELGEIEHALRKILKVDTAVVLVGEDEKGNKQLEAFLDVDVDTKKMQEELSNSLTFYMIPKVYHNIVTFPVNTNGKIDRKELQKRINES
ncbi:AMP-binding protein [Parvicella tangerina]|uniref:Dimodular nonribosomal peptide synthase n=1 Tax=Parvicella tangerina TaxID=2829795 RepID=A0A916JKR2_9FLAO|nr:AMP-binding protein [Parvicella tangerina]CAG5079741.1 Dimodular nonribosomal peptide synthase [Parvicella tangerina]